MADYFSYLTVSMLTVLQDCQLRFFNAFVRRLTPKKEADFFKWGGLVHKALEGVGQMEDTPHMVARLNRWIENQELRDSERAEYKSMMLTLTGFHQAYIATHEVDNLKYEAVESEKVFRFTLPRGGEVRGKLDRIALEKRFNEYFVWEIKTAASAGETYWRRLALDAQLKTYLLAAQHMGFGHSHRAIYDLCKKPQKKQHVKETIDEYRLRIGNDYVERQNDLFERRVIPFTQEDLDKHAFMLQDALDVMNMHFASGLWLPACASPLHKSSCPYMPLCFGGSEDLYYVREELSPELEEVEDAADTD
jgi:hypothetical protein